VAPQVDIDLEGDEEGAGSLEDAVAGDGSLPGGMTPEQLAELMQSEAACRDCPSSRCGAPGRLQNPNSNPNPSPNPNQTLR
jgi:hypothetical protein